jgi:hypothetical protein
MSLSSSANPASSPSLSVPGIVAAPSTGEITITHSTSQSILGGNSVHCGYTGTPIHTDNGYLRRFDLSAFGITGDFQVSSVQVGIETALAGGGGAQPSTVNLYTWDPADPFTYANFNAIGSAGTSVADQDLSIITVPVNGTAPAGSTLVVEFFTPDGFADNNSIYVGSNNLGQSSPTFISAASCGIPNPLDTAAIGFPDMHLVMNVTGKDSGTPGTCSITDDIPWAAVSPDSGTTAPGGASGVTVTYDSTGLSTGVYTGTLCIDSNDPVTPQVQVPVMLDVSTLAGWVSSLADASP